MVQTAVIIAGGEGSRLKPLTNDIPKALAPIAGKPMLYWVIHWLKLQGIKNVVIGVAFKKEKIIDYLKENNNFGLNVQISVHTTEGGTAQGFKLAISRYVKDEDFLGMNCDELTNLNLGDMYRIHQKNNPLLTMALAPFHCRFSVVDVEDDCTVSGFRYGKRLRDTLVSIGIYIFNKKIVDLIPDTGSIEDLLFAKIAKDGKIAAYELAKDEAWISVNSIKDIQDAEAHLKSWGHL
ncbi:MAG: nucleotidyltransferase family protein [Candidatus Nanoarchaeia archaeon]|nr:nucleotidyltransferase family protein [Candidatus Nanoarchaeia archaeon]MDD5239269.1 nucleotidyltransferase family protein [Candidatus Nanoarchaeia archaeon]